VRHALVRLSLLELGVSALAVAAGVVAVAWLAGQIYRTGILMHGRRASLREVWRWLRAG
jgi:ABC-2 type transport system permease protein